MYDAKRFEVENIMNGTKIFEVDAINNYQT